MAPAADPSASRNRILVLPFTPSILSDASPLLPLIYTSVRLSPPLGSLLVYFSSPPPNHTDASAGQLYDIIRQRARETWHAFQAFLSEVYATLAAAQWEGAADGQGRVGLKVDVGFEGREGRWEERFKGADEVILLKGYSNLPHPPTSAKQTLAPRPVSMSSDHSTSPTSRSFSTPASAPSDHSIHAYPVVALGGTFDHLHAAHKLLLHSALFLARRKLIVGVISPSLLSGKAHAEYVESLEVRMAGVRDFLEALGGVSPSRGRGGEDDGDAYGVGDGQELTESEEKEEGRRVMLQIVEIHDAFGPTATDPDIQALVISDETRSGGQAVNDLRKGKGWGELDVWCIEVISGKGAVSIGTSHAPEQSGAAPTDASPTEASARQDDERASYVLATGTQVSTATTLDGEISDSRDMSGSPRSAHASQLEERIKTESLKGLDEKTLKEVKMGSTGIRAFLAAQAKAQADGQA